MENQVDIFSKITNQFALKRPFVVYSKPGQKALVGLFQQNGNTYILEDFAETGFVFASFDGERRLLIPDCDSEIVFGTINDLIDQTHNVEFPVDTEAKLPYEKLVEKGVAAIHNGDFGKVVLSRTEILKTNDLDVESVFRRLLTTYPTAFRYLWFHPETGIWMGATPEQLIKTDDQRFNTVALAGTQPFLGIEEVEWQEKEIAEQQFVTDFISESLMSSASGMTFSDPYTAKAGNLLHIKTDIEGTLNSDSNLGDVLHALHPTPAVCGFPKAEAKKFILENEGYDRGFYSGYLGELNKDFSHDRKASELYVNLRCMKINGNDVQLFMGCGITKDSVPEKEFMETVNKSLTMKRIV